MFNLFSLCIFYSRHLLDLVISALQALCLISNFVFKPLVLASTNITLLCQLDYALIELGYSSLTFCYHDPLLSCLFLKLKNTLLHFKKVVLRNLHKNSPKLLINLSNVHHILLNAFLGYFGLNLQCTIGSLVVSLQNTIMTLSEPCLLAYFTLHLFILLDVFTFRWLKLNRYLPLLPT